MTLFHNLKRSATFIPDVIALEFEGKKISYGALYHRSLTVATHLKRLGLARGDRLAIFLPNCPEFIVIYYACQALGLCPIALNPMLLASDLKTLLLDSKPRCLITHAAHLPTAFEAEDFSFIPFIYQLGLPAQNALAFSHLESPNTANIEAIDLQHNEPGVIIYTSGTTGQPKGVVLSQNNLITNIAAAYYSMGLKIGERVLCNLPLSHVFAQNHIVNATLRGGGTVILQSRFNIESIHEAALSKGVDLFFGVPTSYHRLLNHSDTSKALAKTRYFFSAAAPMKSQIHDQWKSIFGHDIYEGYGLTETSPFSAYNHPFHYQDQSIGTPIDGVEMAVFDEEDRPLGAGEVGEVVIRGPNIMLGYLNQPEASAKALRGGWFHTGDIGHYDDRGLFYLLDRKKDMINAAGYKIWPKALERKISALPYIDDIAIVAAPDDDLGECPALFVVLRPGQSAIQRKKELMAFCQREFSRYQIPKYYHLVEALPRSGSGKVLKRALRTKMREKLGKT